MSDFYGDDWIEWSLKRRADKREASRADLDSTLPRIDATPFAQPLSNLAQTITNMLEREPNPGLPPALVVDIAVILRQLKETYNLLRFVNADETRFDNPGYRQSYSFVILPLIRTMIDGFYNCTAFLDDHSRSRVFRVSGYYRIREVVRTEEEAHATDPTWSAHLSEKRSALSHGMRADRITDADLENKKNKWPLLGAYLDLKVASDHREMLKRLTHGYWKEYSSISHASFDGLKDLFPFIASDKLPHEQRDQLDDMAHRLMSAHFARAAGILLCLLTEIQWYFRFEGSNINERLNEIWAALIAMAEVKELYDLRYQKMLLRPLEESKSTEEAV